MDVTRIPLAEVRSARSGVRGETDAGAVSSLAESFGAIGQQTPITVTKSTRNDGPTKIDCYWIVAGRHRVEAARQLGWSEIDAVVSDLDAARAELWEIDENLIRRDLSDAQRAKALSRRRQLMEDLGLVTRHGDNQHKRSCQNGKSFAAETAADTGAPLRSVYRDLKRGDDIDPGVLDEVAGTELDKGVVLDELAATPKAEQRAKLAEITLRRQEAERARKDAEAVNRNTDRVIAMTDAQQFAEWLLARTDLNELPTIISWLGGTKAKDVIAALRRETA